MGNRLYVGNLSYDLSTEDLKQAFEMVGPVTDAKVLQDRETGRSRGFGFVTMGSEADAQKAIREMNGYQLGGRSLRVNEAEDRPQRSGGSGHHQAAGNGNGNGRPRVYENNSGGGGGGRNKEPRRGRRNDGDYGR